jgi:hypothetical protein
LPGIFCHGRGWLAGRVYPAAISPEQPDLCGHFILHCNTRAPRAKRCRVRAADCPGGVFP